MGGGAIQSKDMPSRADCSALEARYGRRFEMQELNFVRVLPCGLFGSLQLVIR
jgi:hypothetical protein